MSAEISKMESGMKTAQKVDSASINQIISAYQNFASKFPKDNLTPDYLYKAAGLANGFGRGKQAVELYETIIHTYPDYKKIPECYFMEAFVYENMLGSIFKAKELYTEFLVRFPEHNLADDARAAISFLGKSPDEMVFELKQMNSDSVRTEN